MWRIGVLLVIAVVAAETNSASANKDGLIQRLKRSYYHEHSCFGPPPPPPRPYWPPPPPPPFWPPPPRHRDDWGDGNAYSGASAQAAASSQADSSPAKLVAQDGQGCDSCGGSGKNSAVSNAQSKTGDAVAVAVARASAH